MFQFTNPDGPFMIRTNTQKKFKVPRSDPGVSSAVSRCHKELASLQHVTNHILSPDFDPEKLFTTKHYNAVKYVASFGHTGELYEVLVAAVRRFLSEDPRVEELAAEISESNDELAVFLEMYKYVFTRVKHLELVYSYVDYGVLKNSHSKLAIIELAHAFFAQRLFGNHEVRQRLLHSLETRLLQRVDVSLESGTSGDAPNDAALVLCIFYNCDVILQNADSQNVDWTALGVQLVPLGIQQFVAGLVRKISEAFLGRMRENEAFRFNFVANLDTLAQTLQKLFELVYNEQCAGEYAEYVRQYRQYKLAYRWDYEFSTEAVIASNLSSLHKILIFEENPFLVDIVARYTAQSDIAALSRFYNWFSADLDRFAQIWYQTVYNRFFNVFISSKRNKEPRNRENWVFEALNQLEVSAIETVVKCFNNSAVFQGKISEAFLKLFNINNNELVLELVRYCDYTITRSLNECWGSGESVSSRVFDDFVVNFQKDILPKLRIVEKVLQRIVKTKGEYFLSYYKVFLSKRLLNSNYIFDLEVLADKIFVNELVAFMAILQNIRSFPSLFGTRFDGYLAAIGETTQTLETRVCGALEQSKHGSFDLLLDEMLYAICGIFEDYAKINSTLQDNQSFRPLILNGRSWPNFTNNNFSLKLNEAMANQLKSYCSEFFKDSTNSAKLMTWNFALHFLELEYKFGDDESQSVRLQTLLIIGCVLLLFNEQDCWKYDEMISKLSIRKNCTKEDPGMNFWTAKRKTSEIEGKKNPKDQEDPDDLIKRSLMSLIKLGLVKCNSVNGKFAVDAQYEVNQDWKSDKKVVKVELSRLKKA